MAPTRGAAEKPVHGRDAGDEHGKASLRTWLQLIKCSKRVEQEMSARFREDYRSSLSRFDVLAHLYEAGERGLSTTQLARRLLASKGNITRLLDRMEQYGLIRREPNPEDRRISDVFLSDEGAALFARMQPAHERWSDEIFGVLTAREKETLIDLLLRVRQHLDGRTDAG